MSFESPLARALRLAGQALGQGISNAAQLRAEEARRQEQLALQEQERQREVNLAEGQRFVNQASQNLDSARNNLAQMRALGAPRERIAAQEELVNRLEDAASAPIMDAPEAFRGAMSGEVVPERRDVPTPRERAIGRESQVLFPSISGGEQLARGAGTVASLQRTAAVDEARAESIMNDLAGFTPGDPNSVFRAYTALERADSLPPALREGAVTDADAITNAFENSPEAQQLYENAVRMDEIGVERGEQTLEQGDVALERSQRELDYFKRTSPLEYARLRGRVGGESADRVVNALNTGVTGGLSDAEKNSLVNILPDVDAVEDLPSWSEEKVAQTERRTELELQYMEKRNESVDQQLRIGEQTFDMNEFAMDRNAWNFERDKYMARTQDRRAAVQDERTLAEGISNAVANNDTELLAFYMSAYNNPDSALGSQMRTLLGEGYDEDLADMYAGARERQALELQMLQDDAAMRGLQVESARLKLDQAETLTPLETEALRIQYERDTRAATLDLRMMDFQNATNVITRGGEIAKAVPPEFWDDLPSNLAEQFEEVGIDPVVFRNISEHEAWLRGSEQRQQGFQMLTFLTQSPPEKEADREVMLDGVFRAAEMMGFDDPAAQTAFAASAMSIWAESDENMRLRHAQLAAQSARALDNGADPTDTKRILDGWSSVATSRRQEANEIVPQRILNSGCATPLDLGVVEGIYINPNTWKETGNQGQDCSVLRQEYDNVLQSVTFANEQQRYWARQLGEGETGTPETGGAQPPPLPTGGQNTTGSNEPLFTNNPVTELEDGSLQVAGQTLPPMLADRARGWYDLTESGQNTLLSELVSELGQAGTQQVLDWIEPPQ